MSPPLIELLFKEYRQKVLGLLLLHPDQAYHVREIARLTGTVPGTLHKELSKLAEGGVLKKESHGNQVSYRANTNCVIFEELASILRKTSGIADVLAEALMPLAERIEMALIFGSVASGKATEGSDIDVLLIGNLAFSEAVKVLYPAQNLLGREINPKLFTPEEWRAVQQQNSAFVRELMENPVIFLIGGKDDLGQFGGQEPGAYKSRRVSH